MFWYVTRRMKPGGWGEGREFTKESICHVFSQSMYSKIASPLKGKVLPSVRHAGGSKASCFKFVKTA